MHLRVQHVTAIFHASRIGGCHVAARPGENKHTMNRTLCNNKPNSYNYKPINTTTTITKLLPTKQNQLYTANYKPNKQVTARPGSRAGPGRRGRARALDLSQERLVCYIR